MCVCVRVCVCVRAASYVLILVPTTRTREKMNVVLMSVVGVIAGPASLPNGDAWHDTSGNQIEAHGGGILKIGATYHW